jgi:hypothetical protein
VETTVEFDLSVEQIQKILDPDFSGPLGALARRMSAKQMERMAKNLAGPTAITVTDAGIRLVAAGSERQIDWSDVRSVNERTHAWVLLLAPSGVCMIPADSVPADRIAELGAQLRTLAGSKYKVRDGGLRRR